MPSTEPTHSLPAPDVIWPVAGPPVTRPDAALIAALRGVSSATASALLHRLGVRQTFIQGPVPLQPNQRIIGPALTLQFMPQREDIASGAGQEYVEKRTALWAVLEEVQRGDVLVVQANGDRYTGCLGEMLVTYFKGRGGAGIIIDGCVRDGPRLGAIDLPIWARGYTPNYASQAGLFPWGYNVPIACANVLVLAGDIIIADLDGSVVVPARLAPLLVQEANAHEDWESFSRMRLAEGRPLQHYYPLDDLGQRDYQQWRAAHGDEEQP
ncbi:MAG: ribonuclease activity regulator RraA [Ktedonobacterales bacterium]|nr:ribonuclease activity regulator RraA [Ktedonobacterales bacterium]